MSHRLLLIQRLVLAVVLLSACLPVRAAGTDFAFASGDQPSVIVISRSASAAERFAADELAKHLSAMTKRQYLITTDDHTPKNNYIAVGESAAAAPYKAADYGVEQYVIDVSPDRLIIVGGKKLSQNGAVQDRGTLYGVYEIIEELGVRWYRPEAWGTYIPDNPTPRLSVRKRVSKQPDYLLRSSLGSGFQRYHHTPTSSEMQTLVNLWAVRNRLNWHETGGDPKYGGEVPFTFEHSYYLYVPPKEYFQEHPDYFPLVNGKRVPEGQLCLGNPELQKLFVQKIIEKAKSHPDALSITVDPNDGGGWCECALCKALDDPQNPTVHSNRLANFNNMVARKLSEAVPGARIHYLAYSETTRAPTSVKKLEPNTVIMVSSINEWNDWSKPLFDKSSYSNQSYVKNLRAWFEMKPSALMAYEYWSGGYAWPGPLPLVRTVADRLQNYRKYNITGIYSEAEPQWGPQGINLYFIPKLLWNPDLDVEKELNLYYQNYFGPTAGPMKAYYDKLQAAFETANPPVYSGGRGMHFVFTPTLIKALSEDMNAAQAAVKGNSVYERRLLGVWAGHEFARRISEVLETKKREGKLVVHKDGKSSHYESAKAAQQFDEAVKFLLSFDDNPDGIFDVIPKAPDYGSLSYLRRDVLENDAYPTREEESLKKF